MNKIVKIFALSFLISLMPFYSKVFAAEFNVSDTVTSAVDTNKEWVVKFNAQLNADTINNKNIMVTDENGTAVPAIVSPGSTNDSIVVSPKVTGYDPDEKYKLVIGTNVESVSGKRLTEPVTMTFTTTNKYDDGTNYENLPQIESCKFEYAPLLSSQNQIFDLSTKNGENVQYRIFVHSYADDSEVYSELTNGYTSATDGKITALKTLAGTANGQKYKVVVYVKRDGQTGAHKDANTDYDNNYVDYFSCTTDPISNDNNTYSKYDSSLDQIVDIEKNSDTKAVFVESNDFTNEASKNQIKYYVDPNNFLNNYGKYQFLELTYSDGITADDLNNILKGKGILEGEGQAFLDAAKNNNVNVAYLVSHALLETGNGTSVLANGGLKDSSGNYTYGAPVYNFFGIGAYDSDPDYNGTKTAYENKWLTPEDAIAGGANWITSQYINNPQYKQDTLYKMRWNPGNSGVHQYATDVAWAYKQISNIKNILDQAKDAVLNFDIPEFK